MKPLPLHRASRSAAFTMIEIMLVVMIIAILAGAAIGLMGGNVNLVKIQRAQTDVANVATQVQLYESMCYNLPSSLKDLVEKPGNVRNWHKFMESVPQDPWGVDYILEVPNKRSKKTYDLFSAGPDRKPHTEDDVGNWDAK